MTIEHARRVIGVRFKTAQAVSFYDPGDLEIAVGDKVVVDTPSGPDVGNVAIAPGALVHRDAMVAIRPAIRVATDSDLAKHEVLKVKEAEALVQARAKSRILGLQMKFSSARISLDERKVVLELTAAERVELRELYRKLTDALKGKVELRSVGPRDEAKNIGGLGRCGQVLCCASWLDKFESVTVRMAKEQALPISAEDLAGQCGRLKCCLRFEYEQYRATNKILPHIGELVKTPEGFGRVLVGHAVKETVSVALERRDENEFARTVEFPLSDIERKPREEQPPSTGFTEAARPEPCRA
jgi:cell fate regulator YaaT (PSP1 superfamily)